jgi:TolB protein
MSGRGGGFVCVVLLLAACSDTHVPEVRNGVIAYIGQSSANGDQALYTVRADGDHTKQLTHISGLTAAGLSWSPDGRTLVFGRGISEGHSELEIIASNGTGLHAITHDFAVYNQPAWSPDGRRIAFSSGGDLFIMNADGSSRQRILRTAPACGVDSLSWSPDGLAMVYAASCFRTAPGTTAIGVVSADGTRRRMLVGPEPAIRQLGPTDHEHVEYSTPAWSPDGERIAFVETHRTDRIYLMNDDGTGIRALTSSNFDSVYPVWSPDGSTIAFLLYGPHHMSQIATMNADGSELETVTHLSGGASWPAWQRLPSPA